MLVPKKDAQTCKPVKSFWEIKYVYIIHHCVLPFDLFSPAGHLGSLWAPCGHMLALWVSTHNWAHRLHPAQASVDSTGAGESRRMSPSPDVRGPWSVPGATPGHFYWEQGELQGGGNCVLHWNNIYLLNWYSHNCQGHQRIKSCVIMHYATHV